MLLAGLLHCGKSCRLRWINYLRPDLKRGLLTTEEEQTVIDLHAKLGNRWSKIAAKLPERTDNEIKNHWNTHIKKKLIKMGIDPATHQLLNNTMVATSQSTTSIESAKSSDTGDVQSLKECSQETVPVPTDSSEQSSWLEQSSNACRHDLDPVMNWQLEVDFPIDEPWLNFMSRNSDAHGIVADPLATDGAMDWLLDYQDFGVGSSNSVGNSMVRS